MVAVLAATGLTVSPYQTRQDIPALTHPFGNGGAGHVADNLLTPLARWDTIWYLTIARTGYVGTDGPGAELPPQSRAAFFPAYPVAVRATSGFSKSPRRLLPAALLVSFTTFLGALWLLYKLAELERGPSVARAAVYLVAFSPMAFFFSAPYTESLFLLLSVGAVYAARRERWLVAGVLAGVASGTRNLGVLLLLPLALMYFFPRGRGRQPLRPDAAFLLLAPLGLLAFSWHLHGAIGDFLGWAHSPVGAHGDRHFVGPVIALKDALADGWNALAQLADSTVQATRFQLDMVGLVALAASLAGAVGVWRELGAAYGSYTAIGAMWPLLATPNDPVLISYPRYVLVLFPLFIWLAIGCERRGITTPVVAASAVLLGLFTAEFATWHFVA